MNALDFDPTCRPDTPALPTSERQRLRLPVFLALVTVFTMLVAACSSTTGDGDQSEANGNGGSSSGVGSDDTDSDDLDSADIVLTSGLETVAGCDDLLQRLREEGSKRVGPYGFGEGWFGMPVDDMAVEMTETDAGEDAGGATADMERSAAPAAEVGANGGDGEFSGTNVQEQRVDEADLVKTDGRRLVTVAENQIQVIDVTADPPRLERTIKLPDEFWGGELFLYRDTALLMTSGWTEQPFMSSARTADLSWFPGSPTGRLMEVDLNRGEIVRTFEFEGSYLSAREIDNTIRIALTASASRFEFLFPSNPGAEEQAEQFNRELIENSTIEQWIPTYRIIEGSGSGGLVDDVIEEGLIVECDRVHLPEEFAGFGSLVVLTADLSDGLRLKDSLSVFTDATTVYASTDRMAVATPRWPTIDPASGMPQPEDSYRTALHTFDITDPDRTDYVASGSVDGHLLNQYSLSEYDGYLRVATTDGSPWAFAEGMPESESFVTVLDEQDGRLVEVGKVGGLGRGEQIFAVRFLGDRGYVVTFRQIDPLYTLDLSDPTNPTVEGELKIPGFSNYLHPLDDGLLMGVGMDGDESGVVQGAVVSLFDVSDPANPIQLDKLPLVEAPTDRAEFNSYTPVNSDARAFTYWDETAIVPVSWWKYTFEAEQQERNGSEAVMIQINDRELVEVGRVAHPYLQECEGLDGPIRRYVELDDQGNIVEGSDRTPDSSAEPTDNTTATTARPDDAEAGFVDREEPDDEPAVGAPIRPKEDYCWIHSPEIMRTVVVGDILYTVSYNGVGVHNFESGSTISWIPFDRL
jgi:hypothetical protein